MYKRKSKFLSFFKLSLALSLLLGSASLLTPYPAQLVRAFQRLLSSPPAEPIVRVIREVVQLPGEKETIILSDDWKPLEGIKMPDIILPPFPPALPERVESGRYEHINEMARGVNIVSQVNFKKGSTASLDREKRESYAVKVSLELLQPEAGDAKDLERLNPLLPKILPEFDALMANARVSTWFSSLYLHKKNRIRKEAATFGRLLDRHNFYDTETILQIKAPESNRKLIWVQADMDVLSDGSDGDRLSTMPKRIVDSEYYQPSTSYRWERKTDKPNPLIEPWRKRLAERKKNRASASSIDHAQRVVYDLARYSFLLADYDPFIVISLSMLQGNNDYKPKPGDYALVIVGKKIIPAIVGDYGPRFKSGEASLRLCKEVNPRTTIYSRPVSDLTVSYLIFPGTKEKEHGPIDYPRLYEKCESLLDEIGGLGEGYKLHHMSNLLPSD